jgi:hypothetical protein
MDVESFYRRRPIILYMGPSLSEFTNIRPEATVNPGVVLDSRDAVSQLNQSAQFNANMSQRKYELGLENLKGIYQDLGAIQATPVLQEDRPLLNRKMADILNTIAADPHAALGGPKFNEIQRGLGELRSLSTASKQDNLYDEFNKKAIQSDPALATPQNMAIASDFIAQPLGQRKKQALQTPVRFDPEAAMGKILQQKQVAVPYANTSFEGPHNEWMLKETGTTYRRQSALDLWNQGYETGTDANNQPIKRWAYEQFNRIKNDPQQFEKFGSPKDPQEFYQNLGAMMYGAKDDIVGEKTSVRTANPYSMLSAKQNNALYMEAIKEGNREKLAAVKNNLRLQGAPENANFLVRQYANVVGNTTGKTKSVELPNGKFQNEEEIDVPTTILKNYASSEKSTIREGRSADPIVETIVQGNTPDLTTRTPDGNVRLTFYKHYEKSDKIPKGKHVGDLVTDSNGNVIMNRTGIIPRRNLLATMGKGVVETKILAASIDAADKSLKGQPNSVIDRINSGEEDGTVVEQANKAKVTAPKKEKYPLPSGKPRTVTQGGYTYTWNTETGKYE